jgi:hypothetical protein
MDFVWDRNAHHAAQDTSQRMLMTCCCPCFLLQYAHMDFVWDRNAHHAVDLVDLLYRFAPE